VGGGVGGGGGGGGWGGGGWRGGGEGKNSRKIASGGRVIADWWGSLCKESRRMGLNAPCRGGTSIWGQCAAKRWEKKKPWLRDGTERRRRGGKPMIAEGRGEGENESFLHETESKEYKKERTLSEYRLCLGEGDARGFAHHEGRNVSQEGLLV